MAKTAAKPPAKAAAAEAKTESARPERSGRLSADDWAQAALDMIAEQGVAAVAVEPLARRLGVTKGSFYWHFPSREALLQAALERWESVEQEDVFGTLERVPDPRERLRALFQMVAHEYQSHVIYSALLKALDHPAVQPVIDRVSKRRLDYLTASFRQTGLGREDAQHRARLTYAAYVGFLQLNLQLHQARMPQEEFEAYVEHLARTLVPA
ncbi:MAG TPA: TetR/AcrR family transcriptional regulator [Luteimonas sp.]|nr:TetR/AcrR family transcriptional regulator [Luteimonas sp.]HRP73311.1 TetR/AcrR family transcriptional regulator [Luteimonas sp.]